MSVSVRAFLYLGVVFLQVQVHRGLICRTYQTVSGCRTIEFCSTVRVSNHTEVPLQLEIGTPGSSSRLLK